jgi:nitronate monooxygenase
VNQLAELPIYQAGMGGGLAPHELAAAVSDAGGLGTIGFLPATELASELAQARQVTSAPIAVNLLLPFARSEHWRVAAEADAVVTFWGRPERHTNGVWIHQAGSVGEAQAAQAAGADAVIVQGVEGGGHVRGSRPALELLSAVMRALPDGFPALLAGGIRTADDVRTALDAGASGVVVGTRFLMTEESAAHPTYKRALVDADETVLTELFGLGWPAQHRVIHNEATERWLRGDPRGPSRVRGLHRLTAPVLARLPESVQESTVGLQHPAIPLFGPLAPTADRSEELVRSGPLYSGESVKRIHDIRPAGEVTRALAEGL